MSRVRIRALLAAIGVLALVAGPVAADTDEIELIRQDVWLHAATTPIGNADAAAGAYLTWDETEPEGSVPFGAGGAYLGNNLSVFTDLLLGGQRHDNTLTMAGTFTGELDTWAFDLYFYSPLGSAIGCGMDLAFELWIDDEDILWQDQAAPSPLGAEDLGDGLFRTRFVFTNLHEAMTRYGVDTGPDVTHEIFLNAANFYVCQEAVWVYDSAEAPSGAVFNPDSLAGYTIVDVFNPPPPIT